MGIRPHRRIRLRALARAAVACAAVLALVTSLVGAPASAEVIHPRQQWLRDSTAGLFLHWGMFTAPKHLDCAQWERDVVDGGWSADYWVDEARKLGASYIVLATFHSRLGYARPWPSKIPGSCATQTDLLGKLVAAGKAKGVHIILYMTDDPQWHMEQGFETLDSAAYSAWKGQQVDLTTRPGFGQYSYDLFFEVMRDYPDLSGFWIDNDNEYWEQNRLYEQIRQLRPDWLLSNNNEDTPIMDTVSNEQKTGMIPSYDYPAAAWTPMPRLVEADYKLPSTGEWWFDGGNHQVDTRLSTGRYITNAGSSMKSLMDETPMVNGKFPAQQEAFNNFMAQWVTPIRSSLFATEGGGYMFGGVQPGFWNDGAHGVVTVERGGAKTQYVHVVTRPRTDFVRLRDNGYPVTAVTDLRTGQRMRFAQSAGYLTILGVTAWDEFDTVFKVETAGRQFLYDRSVLRATASSSREGAPAGNLVDGSYETWWDSNAQLPVSVTLDLGRVRTATYLAVNQREWSPTYARETFGRPEDSARIKDYRVSVSANGRTWKQVRANAMRSARGTQFIDLGLQFARFVKLDVLNTWAGPQAPRFTNQLQIDEINVGYAYPFAFSPALPLEAERAGTTGRAHLDLCLACSGAQQVVGLGRGPRNAVTYPDVTVAAAGDYRLQIDHTSAAAGSLSVSVNGAAPKVVTVPADNADVPLSTGIPVTLGAGANTVTLFSTDAKGPGVDRISVGPLPPANFVPKTTLTVLPGGIQWVDPGQQSIRITGKLRLDADDAIDGVTLAPVAPAGWTVTGSPVTAGTMRLGQTLEGAWTLTSPPGQNVDQATIPVTASFGVLGRPNQVSRPVQIRLRPPDRVWMREAEDSGNQLGSSGITGCGRCSGGQKVRNIGGTTDAFVRFPNVRVPAAGEYTLFIDYTVNGTRSFFISVNDGAPVEAKVTGLGNVNMETTTVRVTLKDGANTIKVYNDTSSAPDLDRLSLG